MLKKIIFLVMYLNLLKSPANGFIINRNDTINQWLQSINIHQNQEETADTSLTRKEQSELNPINVSKTRPAKNEETPVPISHVLETLQTQINEADNEGKKYYKKLLTDIEQMFTQKSRYARVFFNHMWHVVDFGLYGSSQRTRDASTVHGMLKPLRDLIKWVYKNIVDLLTWNIATDEDDDDDYKPPVRKEEDIEVTTKVGEKGEDMHKISHKFEIDPFTIKLNMDITCRILDDSKDPNHPSTSSSHHEGEHKVSQGKDKVDDDWEYSASKKTPKPDQKDTPSGSQKDSKPAPASPSKEVGSGSTANSRKESDASKVDKGKSPADDKTPVSSSPSDGSNSNGTTQGGEKKPKKFEGNPVDKDLIANPPPPDKPLSYSQMKRMKPQPKTPPPADDDDDEIDWGPGYDRPENNPHMQRVQ